MDNCFFFQAEDGIRDPLWSRGLGDVYKRQIQNILGKIPYGNVSFLKSTDLKVGDGRIVSNKHAITKLVAHYLMNEKNKKGLPINDVCRFHLGNGAIIDDININANAVSYTHLTLPTICSV